MHTLTDLSQEERVQLTKDYYLALDVELAEVLLELRFKKHTVNDEVDISKVQIELIDCFKYLLNMMMLWDIDAEMLVQLFHHKSQIVEDRYARLHTGH